MPIRQVDMIRDPTNDLGDDLVFEEVERSIDNGEVDGILMSPPCNTFSAGRRTDRKQGEGKKKSTGGTENEREERKSGAVETEERAVASGSASFA